MTANQRTESMTTLCQQRPAGGQRACQKPGARVLHFHVTNCTHKLHSHFHEARKIQCNNVSSSVRSQIIDSHFLQIEALPLDSTSFLRLANSSPMAARSPARWQRDGRAISGKIAGKMSRGIAAQQPVMAGQRQRRCRRMSVETTRKTTCLAPDLAAPCPHWKLARRLATWPRNNRATSRQWPGSGSGNAAERPSRRLARQLALRRTWPRHVQTGNLRDDWQPGRATIVPQSARWPARHLASSSSNSRRQLLSMTIQRLSTHQPHQLPILNRCARRFRNSGPIRTASRSTV